MKYDWIIVGAGAAGLMAAASAPDTCKGLIINKSKSPGLKLLMAGGGQCNVTHGGDIKDFILCYGHQGKRIRSILYKFNNQALKDFFQENGVPLFTRPDGKVFPKSLSGQDVLSMLLRKSAEKGFEIKNNTALVSVKWDSQENSFQLLTTNGTYVAKKILLTCGGCSYASTGSDGSIYAVLKEMGYSIIHPRPALVPIFTENYPYHGISGNSVKNVAISLYSHTLPPERNGAQPSAKPLATNNGSLLFTHQSFSGPAILDISRWAMPGQMLRINFLPDSTEQEILLQLKKIMPGNQRQLLSVLAKLYPQLSRSLLEILCSRAEVSGSTPVSQLSGQQLKKVAGQLIRDTHRISGTGGFNTAMATAGGVCLDQINLKTMESKLHPSLYFAGEVLDIDGNTGGYNLQFAFSSAYTAIRSGLKME